MKPTEQFQQWQRPWWIGSVPMAAAWLAIVIYGTLMPFNLDIAGYITQHGGFWPALGAWLTSPRWIAVTDDVSSLGVSTWASDLVLNLILYIPLGVLCRLAAQRKRERSRSMQILIAVSIVVAASWLLECTQALLPSRYASLNDFFANTIPGVIGALLGLWLRAAHRQVIFWIFRLTAHPLLSVWAWLKALRRRPAVMFVLVALNVALIVGWCMSAAATSYGATDTTVNLLPFARHFARSYDVAALWLGRSLVVYLLIGSLLALTMVRPRARRNLGWLVLLMALLAGGMEVVRFYMGATRLDITEPLIAMCAVGLMFTTLFLLIHAVRCTCRRRQQFPVTSDRRRHTHDYHFALPRR